MKRVFICSSSHTARMAENMTRRRMTILLIWLAAATVAGQRTSPHAFDSDRPGVQPEGFTFGAMRQSTPGTWLVGREGQEGYLLHRADPAARGLALAISPDAPLHDVVASARVRLAGGARAGGLVWRYLDAGNYHAVLLDLAKGELALFRVAGGNRVILESEDDLELDTAAWHTLKIAHREGEINVSIGGIRVFRERNRRYDQPAAPGRTGVVATGDSEVWFDNLRIEPDRRQDRK
jgi:hypothetical protein